MASVRGGWTENAGFENGERKKDEIPEIAGPENEGPNVRI